MRQLRLPGTEQGRWRDHSGALAAGARLPMLKALK